MEDLMNMQPLVSIIMAIHNTPTQYVEESIKSILKQTYDNFELIIINDGSNENIDYHLDSYNDPRIIIINNKKNIGASASRNKGLKIAKGQYIAIMDSDDVSCETRIEKQVGFLETHPDIVVCGTWFKFIGNKIHEKCLSIKNQEYYRACLIFNNSPTILHSSAMIRKNILDAYKIKYDEKLVFGEDYMLWVLLSEHGKVAIFPEILVFYRVHNSQSSSIDILNKTKLSLKVKKYILNKINLKLSDEEIVLYSLKQKKYKDIVLAFKTIDKILEYNNKYPYFDQKMLSLRCDEQKENNVRNCHNPFVLFRLLFSKDLGKITRRFLKHKITTK